MKLPTFGIKFKKNINIAQNKAKSTQMILIVIYHNVAETKLIVVLIKKYDFTSDLIFSMVSKAFFLFEASVNIN